MLPNDLWIFSKASSILTNEMLEKGEISWLSVTMLKSALMSLPTAANIDLSAKFQTQLNKTEN